MQHTHTHTHTHTFTCKNVGVNGVVCQSPSVRSDLYDVYPRVILSSGSSRGVNKGPVQATTAIAAAAATLIVTADVVALFVLGE